MRLKGSNTERLLVKPRAGVASSFKMMYLLLQFD
jgi:hypothetical protein